MERQAPPLSATGRHSAALTLAVALLAACVSIAPRPADGPATDNVAWLWPRLQGALAAGPRQAVLEGRASQYGDAGALKGKIELLLDRDRGFRMTGLSPTDDVLSVVASSDATFTAFARGGDHCHVGRPCPSNVARFASVALAPRELAGVLLGRPPLLLGEANLAAGDVMRWDGEARAWVFTRSLGGDSQTLWLAVSSPRILRARLTRGGGTVVDVRYSDFAVTAAGDVPRRLDMTLARDDTDLRIEVAHLDPNPELPPEAFEAACPLGMTRDELPCLEPLPAPPAPADDGAAP